MPLNVAEYIGLAMEILCFSVLFRSKLTLYGPSVKLSGFAVADRIRNARTKVMLRYILMVLHFFSSVSLGRFALIKWLLSPPGTFFSAEGLPGSLGFPGLDCVLCPS